MSADEHLSPQQFMGKSGWQVQQVPTGSLLPYTDDTLSERPEGFMDDLRASMAHGWVGEPLKPMGGTTGDPVTGIWDGKHRLQVARQLGHPTVPALVTPRMQEHLGGGGPT